MSRLKLLDLFCGQGGAAKGYHDAGFDVVGVDINPQPRYPFGFHQADALEFLTQRGHEFDAIHASPTCQTRARVTAWRGDRDNHPDTLTPTLATLRRHATIPWVVENVPEAVIDGTMRADYLLCGTMFGLPIRRHRAFETSGLGLQLSQQCRHRGTDLAFEHKNERAYTDALGCHWMTTLGGRQAIPPAYTQHIGAQLIEHMSTPAPCTHCTADVHNDAPECF
jgi:hypothetical protein